VCNGCRKDLTFFKNLIRSDISYIDVNVVKLNKNYGYAGAIYIIRSLYKDADIYVISNDDIKIDREETLYRLIKTIMENQSIVAVSPKILNYYDRNRYDYAGAAGFYLDFLLTPFCRGRLFDFLTKDVYNDVCLSVTMPSGCFMVLKNTKETVVDPYLFLTYEEADIAIKALSRGFRICCDSTVYIYHKGSVSFGNRYSSTRLYYVFRNRLYMLMKYSSFRYIVKNIPLVVMLDFISAFSSSLMRNRSTMLSWLSAYLTIIKSIKKILTVRRDHNHREYLSSIDSLYEKGLLTRDIIIVRYLLRYLYARVLHPLNTFILWKIPYGI
jgi:GT2 family glycosyltransferase